MLMKNDRKKDFDKEAAAWDKEPRRVKLAHDVADTLMRAIKPTPVMDALDYGCGTGLVTLCLQPHVRTITGADSSQGMITVLQEKVKKQSLKNVRAQLVDFELGERVTGTFHLIVSSMTLHHVCDPAVLFEEFHALLHPGGYLCIADLDAEDGSFHGDNTGVFHFGFDRAHVKALFKKTGFSEIEDTTAAVIAKPGDKNGERQFAVFLITGKRR
ncbi:MAG TPA: class I SAM-dependent methyltransferase [Nitrospirota bacterium]|nr:class I SAM-dependent methyltransferase [Nitrospirota bacterium]